MNTDVAPLHYLMKESRLDEDNIHTKICCFDNIDCNFEHAMHKSVDSTHNLSMDRKFRIRPHARLKFFLHLIWNLECHL